jgi:hypothetical protein
MKPNKIIYEDYDGYVYNIEVENNHNYFVNNILVSNCHEKSTPDGEHGDLDNPVVDTFEPYTEIAIGGGNPLSHPDLEKFLVHLKELKCFPNITINQVHFIEEFERLKEMRDKKLFYGLGISVFNPDEDLAQKILEFPNAVIHTIAGILDENSIQKLMDNKMKVLVLGYKNLGRGIGYQEANCGKIGTNMEILKEYLPKMVNTCKVVSFDNLAIEQLGVKALLFKDKEDEWNEFYMGDDGNFTLYIDAVNQTFAKNSCMPKDERFPIDGKSMTEMFNFIRDRYEIKH